MDIPKADGTYQYDAKRDKLFPVEYTEGFFVAYDSLPESIDDGQLVGVWSNPVSGEKDVELTSWWSGQVAAEAFGRENNQLAIWDIALGKAIWL